MLLLKTLAMSQSTSMTFRFKEKYMSEYLSPEEAKTMKLPLYPLKRDAIVAEHMRRLGVGNVAFFEGPPLLGRGMLILAAEERALIEAASVVQTGDFKEEYGKDF